MDCIGQNPVLEADGLQVSWTESFRKDATTLLEAMNDTDTSSIVTITAGEAGFFGVDDIIKGDATAEYMRVTGVGLATDELTLDRGYAGTTKVTHAINEILRRLFAAMGPDLTTYPNTIVQQVNRSNYAQRIYRRRTLDESYVLANKPFQGSQLQAAITVAGQQALEDLERAITLGRAIPTTPQGAAGKAPSMNGFVQAFENPPSTDPPNQATVTDPLTTDTAFLSYLETAFKVNTRNNLLIFGTTAIRKFYILFEENLRYDPEDTKRGQRILTYDSPYGEYKVVVSRYINANHMYAMERSSLALVQFKPMVMTQLPTLDAGLAFNVGGIFSLRHLGVYTWLRGNQVT